MDAQTAQNISHRVLTHFRQMGPDTFNTLMRFEDYHGFGKSRLPDDFLKPILQEFNLNPEDAQVEVIKVEGDQSDQIHYHKNSIAYDIAMGKDCHVPNPVNAEVYIDNDWKHFGLGQEVPILPNTPHGFSTKNNGVLYFLSVQIPPIVSEVGDDYYNV